MPLVNFGSVISFAEELESADLAFYSEASKNTAAERYRAVLEQFISDIQKNIKNLQRIRRENVTEMILEGITGFTRAPYLMETKSPARMGGKEILETARKLEARAERYYLDAADKIKAQSEVARELKSVAKKRNAHKTQLETIS